eukprot:TRINITY_DN10043_c0_g1_i4.p1 TRINITY_DN10043_c0_g1~~TRINITY_DN10043_c0_g1_i4.p1  ORF type:complete len:1363 (-),score=236.75 TRINITY_DN10043_c0_g1_i4:47-4135(-)
MKVFAVYSALILLIFVSPISCDLGTTVNSLIRSVGKAFIRHFPLFTLDRGRITRHLAQYELFNCTDDSCRIDLSRSRSGLMNYFTGLSYYIIIPSFFAILLIIFCAIFVFFRFCCCCVKGGMMGKRYPTRKSGKLGFNIYGRKRPSYSRRSRLCVLSMALITLICISISSLTYFSTDIPETIQQVPSGLYPLAHTLIHAQVPLQRIALDVVGRTVHDTMMSMQSTILKFLDFGELYKGTSEVDQCMKHLPNGTLAEEVVKEIRLGIEKLPDEKKTLKSLHMVNSTNVFIEEQVPLLFDDATTFASGVDICLNYSTNTSVVINSISTHYTGSECGAEVGCDMLNQTIVLTETLPTNKEIMGHDGLYDVLDSFVDEACASCNGSIAYTNHTLEMFHSLEERLLTLPDLNNLAHQLRTFVNKTMPMMIYNAAEFERLMGENWDGILRMGVKDKFADELDALTQVVEGFNSQQALKSLDEMSVSLGELPSSNNTLEVSKEMKLAAGFAPTLTSFRDSIIVVNNSLSLLPENIQIIADELTNATISIKSASQYATDLEKAMELYESVSSDLPDVGDVSNTVELFEDDIKYFESTHPKTLKSELQKLNFENSFLDRIVNMTAHVIDLGSSMGDLSTHIDSNFPRLVSEIAVLKVHFAEVTDKIQSEIRKWVNGRCVSIPGVECFADCGYKCMRGFGNDTLSCGKDNPMCDMRLAANPVCSVSLRPCKNNPGICTPETCNLPDFDEYKQELSEMAFILHDYPFNALDSFQQLKNVSSTLSKQEFNDLSSSFTSLKYQLDSLIDVNETMATFTPMLNHSRSMPNMTKVLDTWSVMPSVLHQFDKFPLDQLQSNIKQYRNQITGLKDDVKKFRGSLDNAHELVFGIFNEQIKKSSTTHLSSTMNDKGISGAVDILTNGVNEVVHFIMARLGNHENSHPVISKNNSMTKAIDDSFDFLFDNTNLDSGPLWFFTKLYESTGLASFVKDDHDYLEHGLYMKTGAQGKYPNHGICTGGGCVNKTVDYFFWSGSSDDVGSNEVYEDDHHFFKRMTPGHILGATHTVIGAIGICFLFAVFGFGTYFSRRVLFFAAVLLFMFGPLFLVIYGGFGFASLLVYQDFCDSIVDVGKQYVHGVPKNLCNALQGDLLSKDSSLCHFDLHIVNQTNLVFDLDIEKAFDALSTNCTDDPEPLQPMWNAFREQLSVIPHEQMDLLLDTLGLTFRVPLKNVLSDMSIKLESNIVDAFDELQSLLTCPTIYSIVDGSVNAFCGELWATIFLVLFPLVVVSWILLLCGVPTVIFGYKRFPHRPWGPDYRNARRVRFPEFHHHVSDLEGLDFEDLSESSASENNDNSDGDYQLLVEAGEWNDDIENGYVV